RIFWPGTAASLYSALQLFNRFLASSRSRSSIGICKVSAATPERGFKSLIALFSYNSQSPVSHSSRKTSAAIVTTLKSPGPTLASFLKYHEAIGFSRFFLFFDDPADRWIKLAKTFGQARIIKTDVRLRRAWQRTTTARTNPWFFQYVETELKVRQTLNVELAINLA